jgi:predicted Rossmann fold flavoprotein
LLFTHHGLSGPVALDASGAVARLLEETGKPVPVRLHLTPETNAEAWSSALGAWRTTHPRRLVRSLVSLHLPHSLAEAACAETGVGGDLRAAELPRETQRRLAEWLAGVTVDIVGTEGFNRAMVSAGGVSLREVDPRTLESRLVRGLYFAGEVLDVDGPCGGYNLQWAFSSGKLAGESAARPV